MDNGAIDDCLVKCVFEDRVDNCQIASAPNATVANPELAMISSFREAQTRHVRGA